MPRPSKEKKYERKRRKCTFTLSDQSRNFLANNVTNASRFVDELIKGAEKGIQSAIVAVSPKNEWARRDSNSRPPPCEGDVITS